ncbi:MAG: rhodanese-like domain-containing protein [Ileibacterium sp.]|nr:rhodanese-like domain-containing protein [Ileibacterium sp.]
MNSNSILIDVRTPEEYSRGHIPGAINIPNETITNIPPKQLPDKNAEILSYCQSGMRSEQAVTKLKSMGYANVKNIGGIMNWTGDVKTGMQP